MLIDALIENEIICIVSNLSKNHINNPYLYDNLLYPSIWKDILEMWAQYN